MIHTDGTSGSVTVPELSANSQLKINAYPNPFTDQMTFAFSLQEPGQINIKIIDLQGRTIANLKNQQYGYGNHEIRWKATDHNLTPGFYMVQIRLTTGNNNYVQNHKIQLIN